MKNVFKSVIVPTIVLTLICAISTLALGFTNKITEDKIADQAKKAEQQAMSRIISASEFSTEQVDYNGEMVDYHIAKAQDGSVLGYIFTTKHHGYGGDVKVMVGIDTTDKIVAIEVIDASNETPGLGANVLNNSFWEQFKGKTEGLSASKAGASGNEIKAVTGATISSRAVVGAVNTAFDIYKLVTKDGGNNG